MKKIKLTQNKFALVDNEDFDFINQWKWYFNNKGAAVRTVYLGGGRQNQRREMIYMHRLILKAPEDMEVDHINHNTLDNRRKNLRLCTRAQNVYNTRISVKNTSGYKGVHLDKKRNKWVAQISINDRIKYLGGFSTIEEAALAYQRAAIELRGEFAWTR